MKTRDRSPIWIGLADLLLCVVSVVIVAVAPEHKKAGVEEKAYYLISSEWSVDIDADVDLWVSTPSNRPVSYASRDVGCARLDSDNRGFLDEHITLADGTTTKVLSNKETVSLRCIEPGHYNVGVNLYAYHINSVTQPSETPLEPLRVHVEIVGVNPAVRLLWQGDLTLDHVGQTANAISFDLARDGTLTLTAPPLESVTAHAYRASGYPGMTTSPAP